MEENTMAILDTSGFSNSKISHHLDDDRLDFLEAVRTASLLPDNGSAPTGSLRLLVAILWNKKMCEAIFRILKDVDSLDLIIESYQLLVKLDKVYISKQEQADSSSPSKVIPQVIMVEEAWVPFNLELDSYNEKGAATSHSGSSIDSSGFHALIQEIAEVFKGTKSKGNETTFLKNMLLLQYLISVLERDFIPRNCAYHESMNWTLLRESLLHMLLGLVAGIEKNYVQRTSEGLFVSQSTAFSKETSNHENSSAELLRETNSYCISFT
ncbi:isoform X1 [Orobanche minor]